LAVASPAFETMFVSNLSETKENSMEIKDFSPAVVEKLLKFVYDTEIPIEDNMQLAEQLVAIADKYQIEHLKVSSLEFYKFNIDLFPGPSRTNHSQSIDH
jgi:hypothetical protein